MARRKQSGEVNIGSDSFMDVIANIVGILIILIVIAGIRVGRAPVTRKTASSDNATSVTQVAPPAVVSVDERTPDESPKSVPLRPTPAADPPKSETPEVEAPEEPEEPRFVEQSEPPPDHQERLQRLKDDIQTLTDRASSSEAELKDLQQQQARGELQFAKGRELLVQEKAKLESSVKTIEQVQALVQSQQTSLELLKNQLENEKKRAPKVKAIKHQVTPLSRTVETEQIHVRILNNKVSIVPIHELLEASMRQAKKHFSELATARTRFGSAGPIGGYSLQYKLTAEPASMAEQAQHGPGLYRVMLASFKLDPESDLREESIEDALRRGSMFDIAIQTAPQGATFTLWTYPDSFSGYRALQAKLHELGFVVAGRPLPNGVPIAGSPNGSASAGQ